VDDVDHDLSRSLSVRQASIQVMNRINLITLGVRDLKKSLQFYRDIGFDVHVTGNEDGPIIVFCNNEGSRLELFPIDELAIDINAENPPAISPGGFPGITLAYNAKSESEVDEIIHAVRGIGARIIKEPQRLSWGGYGGYFLDPDDYYWEVAFGSNWQFDESNMLIID